jgi:hypothetical protein
MSCLAWYLTEVAMYCLDLERTAGLQDSYWPRRCRELATELIGAGA